MNFLKRYFSCLAYLGFFALCFILTIPPFLNDFIVGHDMLYHLNWNELFQSQLFQGDFYPRWLFEMKGGRGSPVFYFYSPLPYYFSAIFSLFLPSLQSVWLSLGVTHFFALFVSALGVLWFLRFYNRDKYAYLFTAFYVLFPYHVLVDLYIRFAFAEFFAIAWVPYLFVFVKKIADGSHRSVYFLAIFYALLVLSHIPTALLITPFVLIFGCLISKAHSEKVKVLKGLILGGVLSAFYLLPILSLKKYVSLERMVAGDLFYRNSFLLTDYALDENRAALWSFLENLSLVSIAVIILSMLIVPQKNKIVWFFFSANLFSIFMMYPFSVPFWEIIPLVKIVQLPWRFYIVISFVLFFMAVHAFDENEEQNPVKKILGYLVVTLLITTSIMTGFHCYGKLSSGVEIETRPVIERSLIVKDGVREYLPAQTPEIYYEQVTSMTLQAVDELFEGTREKVVSKHEIMSGQLVAQIENDKEQTILLNQFYFPTWEGYDITGNKPIHLRRSAGGFLEFDLDVGLHQLRFSHKQTKAEIAGLIVSCLAALYVFSRLVFCREESHQNRF